MTLSTPDNMNYDVISVLCKLPCSSRGILEGEEYLIAHQEAPCEEEGKAVRERETPGQYSSSGSESSGLAQTR